MSVSSQPQSFSQHYASIDWNGQIPEPAWEHTDIYQRLQPSSSLSLSEKMYAVWQKMTDSQKLDYILANVGCESESEYVNPVVDKCWKYTKHLPNSKEIINIREQCLTFTTTKMTTQKNKVCVLIDVSGSQEVTFPAYFRRALAVDSPKFQQFFYAQNPGSTPSKYNRDLLKCIEVHLGKAVPTEDFEAAAKFLFIGGHWDLKCDTYTDMFINQLPSLPVNDHYMEFFLDLVTDNNFKLPPRAILPFASYLDRLAENSPRGRCSYAPFILCIRNKILPSVLTEELQLYSSLSWEDDIPKPPKHCPLEECQWEKSSEAEKLLIIMQMLSTIQQLCLNHSSENLKSAINILLVKCWQKAATLPDAKQMMVLRTKCLNLPNTTLSAKKQPTFKIICKDDEILELPKYYRRPLEKASAEKQSPFTNHLPDISKDILAEVLSDFADNQILVRDYQHACTLLFVYKNLNITPSIHCQQQMHRELHKYLNKTFFNENDCFIPLLSDLERVDLMLNHRYILTRNLQIEKIMQTITAFVDITSNDTNKNELYLTLRNIYFEIAKKPLINPILHKEIQTTCLKLIEKLKLENFVIDFDSSQPEKQLLIEQILRSCSFLKVLQINYANFELGESLLQLLPTLSHLTHIYFSKGLNNLQPLQQLDFKPIMATQGTQDNTHEMGLCYLRSDEYALLMNDVQSGKIKTYPLSYWSSSAQNYLQIPCITIDPFTAEAKHPSFTFYLSKPI